MLICQTHNIKAPRETPFLANETEIALKVETTEDIMRAGLQIFTFKEDATAIYKDKDATKLAGTRGEKETVDMLATLIRSGKVIWENQARGINPNPALAKMLSLSQQGTSTPQQKAKSSSKRTPRRQNPNADMSH